MSLPKTRNALSRDLGFRYDKTTEMGFALKGGFPPKEEQTVGLIQNLDSKNIDLRRKSVKGIAYFGIEIVGKIISLYLGRIETVEKMKTYAKNINNK